MVTYRYAFIIGSLLFLPLWILMYLSRKDLQKQMIFMSLSVAFIGTIFEYLMWTIDWWKPETVTGTRVGIEIFILGFTNGGIGAVIYEFINNKKIQSLNKNSRLVVLFNQYPFWIGLPFLTGIFLIITSYWILGLHSFWATLIGTSFAIFLMIIIRHDLLVDSIVGGISMLLIVIPVYLLLNNIFPGVIAKFWMLEKFSGLLILEIPVEDLIFYFTSGMLIAPSYEYLFKKKLVRRSNS